MVFIRSKTVKGDQYLYLVKSVWDSKKSTSRQETIKYLGKLSDVTKEDIPLEYRNDLKISFSSKFNSSLKSNEKLISGFQKKLYNHFKNGDFDNSFKIYNEYRKFYSTTDFFEKILKPVMYKVGDLWAQKKISIATEHICSNVAQSLVNTIKQKNVTPCKKQKVLICTPVGEEHCLGCHVLESYLTCKGFKVYNLSPSAPAESVLTYINEKVPDFVFVSITLEDNLKAGQRLVRKIKEKFELPVFLGGQAIKNSKIKFDGKTIQEINLEKIPQLVTSRHKR